MWKHEEDEEYNVLTCLHQGLIIIFLMLFSHTIFTNQTLLKYLSLYGSLLLFFVETVVSSITRVLIKC